MDPIVQAFLEIVRESKSFLKQKLEEEHLPLHIDVEHRKLFASKTSFEDTSSKVKQYPSQVIKVPEALSQKPLPKLEHAQDISSNSLIKKKEENLKEVETPPIPSKAIAEKEISPSLSLQSGLKEFTLTDSQSYVDLLFCSQMEKTFKELFPKVKLLPNPFPVILLLFKENSLHQQFFENVAKALSDRGLEATVFLVSDVQQLKTFSKRQLLIGPMEDIPNHHEMSVHTLTKIEGDIIFLPLANLNLYLKDPNYKRALWNVLKTLSLNMLLLSSILPSKKP